MGEELEMLLEMAREGCSDEDILRIFGGTTLYIPSWKRVCQDQLIVEKFKQGRPIQTIAGECGISPRRVEEIIHHQHCQKNEHATNHLH